VTHHWRSWHNEYDVPGSPLAQRLACVQERIRLVLDSAPPGPVRVVSLCGGEGRDLFGVLADHPRRSDVTGLLVEWDVHNAMRARGQAPPGIRVLCADAASTSVYDGSVPADLVLLCGIFGNVSEDDILTTVLAAPALCATGGTVVWTRHRRPPDLVPDVCSWFEEAGFERVWVSEPGLPYGVGVHRFTGTPEPLVPGRRLFRFVR
jgi:hypothetical protein